MDDFGNLIYVLAAIGWFFWNAYKKSQKGKGEKSSAPQSRPETQRRETTEPEPDRSWEDVILEALGAEKEEPEPATVEPVAKSAQQHRNQNKFLNTDLDHSHLPDDYQMSVSEGKSHRVKRQVERLKQQEDEKEESLMDELFPEEGFDLRKAVVLNAILDRPYS